MIVDVTRKASITVVCGSSGSGKSAWVKQRIRKAPRVIVWDCDDEYGDEGFERVTSAVDLVRIISERKKARIAFVAEKDKFDFFCRAAFAWGDCIVVAEELAGVTSPGKAPPGWHRLVSRGRKRGIEIIGITQRPSESDKTIMGNATMFHVGAMARAKDRAYMADEMDVPRGILDGIKPLEWVERHRGVAELVRGKMAFRR